MPTAAALPFLMHAVPLQAVALLEVGGIVLYLVATALVLRLAVRWAREAIEPPPASIPGSPPKS